MPEPQKTPLYGGRALAQGVLMIGPSAFAVAIRNDKGDIEAAVERFRMPFVRLREVPFLRGLMSIAGAVFLAGRSTRLERRLAGSRSGRRKQLLGTIAPMLAASFLERMLGYLLWQRKKAGGGPKGPGLAGMFVPMLAFRLSGFTPMGRDLLQYHAAEHMSVNTAEAGMALTAENAATQSRIHPRCGTTFAFWALLLGSRIRLTRVKGPLRGVMIGAVTISLAYEVARFGAVHRDEDWAKFIYGPSWQAQRLTTSPPTIEQLQVACAALKAVVDAETAGEPAPSAIV